MAASRTGVVGVPSNGDVTCVLSFTSAFPTQRRWVMIKTNFQPNALTQRSQPSIWVKKTTQRFLECKLYSNILQRFLTIVKQGDLASDTLTLTLPKPDVIHTDGDTNVNAPIPTSNNVVDVQDQIVDEILHNVPQRSLKNVKFILNKMSNAKQLSTWTNTGEFVFKGRVINGSHMLDLVKSITAPHTIRDEYRPRG